MPARVVISGNKVRRTISCDRLSASADLQCACTAAINERVIVPRLARLRSTNRATTDSVRNRSSGGRRQRRLCAVEDLRGGRRFGYTPGQCNRRPGVSVGLSYQPQHDMTSRGLLEKRKTMNTRLNITLAALALVISGTTNIPTRALAVHASCRMGIGSGRARTECFAGRL